MAFSIRTKVVFPVVLLALVMGMLVASAWYALNETTKLNTSLAGRFDEIEEVRRIEVLFSELIYPHLNFITRPSEEASKQAHEILHEIDHIISELSEMEVVNEEEREITELITRESGAIKELSEKILHSDIYNTNHKSHDEHEKLKELNTKSHGTHKNNGVKENFASHMDKMALLNEISEKHIVKVKEVLADWHADEAREVDRLADDTHEQLNIFSKGVIILALIMISIVVFSLWLNNYVLIRPVVSLTHSTNKFASGNLKAAATVYAEDELGVLARDINQMASSLDKLYSQLSVMAKTDQLTSLLNRHGFEEIEAREVSSAKRYGNPLTLAMLDIDHFKDVNDTYGHSVGDVVICTIADFCKKMFRDCDYSFRYGGEEFIVLMPQTTVFDAVEPMERFRKAVEEKQISADGHTLGVTISIGLAQHNKEEPDGQLIKNADQALYEAKEKGRNRTVSYVEAK